MATKNDMPWGKEEMLALTPPFSHNTAVIAWLGSQDSCLIYHPLVRFTCRG